jgi:hypothetical protein
MVDEPQLTEPQLAEPQLAEFHDVNPTALVPVLRS